MTSLQPHVLIVEDDPAHMEAIRRAFTSGGRSATVHMAGTLREFRERAAELRPDIALVDLNLPDGRAIDILTSPPESAPFPVLIMTSFGNEQTAVEAMKSGALDYVVKSPGAFIEMPRTVERALREWSLLQERRQAMAVRLEMERRLLHAQKLESLGVLAGGIAHDFNNLLMAILGNLDMAIIEMSPSSPARTRIEQAVIAAKRAADLTRQMLAYSGKGQFLVKAVDLNELITENVHMPKAAISKNVTINLRLAQHLPQIMADAGQIQQIVMNLITNASDAIGDETGVVTLATSVEDCDDAVLSRSYLEEKPAAGRFVQLEVTDTGCGMDEATQQRLFDPFFTTKFTGRGLGMSAVLGIVRGHNGALVVESEPGRGATIRVLFPVPETEPAVAERATTAVSPPEEGASARGAILVVDDDDMVRDVCAAMVDSLGFRSMTAADGIEAINLFREHAGEIVAVILDMTMPGMDGVAVFRELLKIRPGVRVILSSGYGEKEITERFTGMGLAGFIQKPYQMVNFQKELERVLKG